MKKRFLEWLDRVVIWYLLRRPPQNFSSPSKCKLCGGDFTLIVPDALTSIARGSLPVVIHYPALEMEPTTNVVRN